MARQSQLAEALADARRRTDELFTLLVPDAFYDRPIPERHRNIFYFGHLEAFDWNLICRKTLDLPSFHPEFDKLFEFGIDPPAGRLPEDQPKDWPSVAEVNRYNTRVRQAVTRALTSGDVPEQLWRVAIEHRLMHAETFAYMLHNLPADRKIEPPGVAARILGPPVSRAMLEVPAGQATLGRKRGNGFGWDNEFDEHTVDVPAFAIDNYKVTNGDYLEFVKAGAPPALLGTPRRRVAPANHVWPCAAPTHLARLRHPAAGVQLRRLDRQIPAHRAAVPSRRLFAGPYAGFHPHSYAHSYARSYEPRL